jgi:hypothetical protein
VSWTAARAALDARLLTLTGIVAARIAWPNVVFPAQTAHFWKVDFLPATVQPELQGADHERGIYQVSIFVPAGTGIGPALVLAQSVADHFKRQVLSGISCGVPVLAPPLQEADWLQIPVSIPFQVL